MLTHVIERVLQAGHCVVMLLVGLERVHQRQEDLRIAAHRPADLTGRRIVERTHE